MTICRYCKRKAHGGFSGYATPGGCDGTGKDFCCWRAACGRKLDRDIAKMERWIRRFVRPKVAALAARKKVCIGCGVSVRKRDTRPGRACIGECLKCGKLRTKGTFWFWNDVTQGIARREWRAR